MRGCCYLGREWKEGEDDEEEDEEERNARWLSFGNDLGVKRQGGPAGGRLSALTSRRGRSTLALDRSVHDGEGKGDEYQREVTLSHVICDAGRT